MKQLAVKFLVVTSLLFVSTNLWASIITFNDRVLFEQFVAEFVIDDLEGLSQGTTGRVRPDFSWTMSDYGCPNSSGCNGYGAGNPFVSGGNDWVWLYNSGNFNFNFGISAFGFDYADPYFASASNVGLQGFESGLNANGSFFGIATTDGSLLTTISYQQFSIFQGIDNVTFSTTANNALQVSAPATFSLFMLALAGIAFSSRKRQK